MRRSIVLAIALVLVVAACSDPKVIDEPNPTTSNPAVESSVRDEGDTATTGTPPDPSSTSSVLTTTSTASVTSSPSSQLPDGVVGVGTPAGVGTTIRVSGFDDLLDVTLAEVLDPATPGLFDPEPGNRYMGLRFVITNRGDGVWSDSPSNSVSVIGDDNTQHSATFADIVEGTHFASTTAAPGDLRQGWIVVELPVATAPSRIRYTPSSGFADETAEWDLMLPVADTPVQPLVTAPTAGVGDAISLMSLDEIPVAVTIDAIADPAEGSNSFSQPVEGFRFVAIQLTLVNEGSSNYQDSVGNLAAAITQDGFSYSTTFAESKAGPGFEGSVLLTPGDIRTGWIVFEVPLEQKLAKVSIALDSGFGPEVGEWSLDLEG